MHADYLEECAKVGMKSVSYQRYAKEIASMHFAMRYVRYVRNTKYTSNKHAVVKEGGSDQMENVTQTEEMENKEITERTRKNLKEKGIIVRRLVEILNV